MSLDQVTLTVVPEHPQTGQPRRVEATRIVFSPHQCFRFDGGEQDRICIDLLADSLLRRPGLALYAAGPLLACFAGFRPDVLRAAVALIVEPGRKPPEDLVRSYGLATAPPDALPPAVRTVFLCETLAFPRQQQRRRLPDRVTVIDAAILGETADPRLPARAWSPMARNIYPLDLPEIVLQPGLDMILMDCPARNLALMPNGLSYVHNALKRADVRFQTFDLDIVAYHRYHINRIYDEGGRIVLPDGREMPVDPWQAEHYDLWADPLVLDHFRPILHEAAAAIIAAAPKILGLSLQQCNEAFTRELVGLVKAELPDTMVLVGGFSCYNADIGRRGFPECDYMCIGEADLTVGPLVEKLARGERPHDMAGVLSRFDSPSYRFLPAPMPHKLEQLPFPRYDWCDLSLYRNYNDYQLTPIIASRGCRWSRCTFCAERFYWRIRPEAEFVDELEWLVDQGCHLFMFNESDLNGDPEKLLAICDEIIRRGLKVKLTGQLRIHKKSDRAFFDKLHAAGFVALRFGVDAFSANTLRLQKKGYTKEIVSRNLRDCWEAGIYTEVNWVIGVPGETPEDVEEGIALILENQRYIGRLSNINPLIMVNGGVYWIDPDSHNIVFRHPKEELYARYPRALPADSWYSTHPYIDAAVRRVYFERIVLALHDAGFPVGSWATRVIDDVTSGRDRVRSSGFDADTNGSQAAHQPDAAAAARMVRSVLGHDLFAYNGRFYGIRQGSPAPDFGQLEVAPPPDVAVGLTEAGALGWIERLAGVTDSLPEPEFTGSNPTGAEDPTLPRFIRNFGTTRIFRYAGRFYALPLAFGEVDLTDPDSLPNGILNAATLTDLLAEIDYADRWADSRGILDSQEAQRRHGSALRADSALGEQSLSVLDSGNLILRRDGQTWSVSPHALAASGLAPDARVRVTHEVSKNAAAELLWSTVANGVTYNIVSFDAHYYAVPQGIPVHWENGDVADQPGVQVAERLNAVLAKIGYVRQAAPRAAAAPVPAARSSSSPRLIGEQQGYNIVEYEGWIYGLPQSLGPIDLADTDVIGTQGVLRDVSRSVIEEEIAEIVGLQQAASAASAAAATVATVARGARRWWPR